MPQALSIVTLNLLNDLTFWPERGPLIVQALRELSPDLVALQEVALPHNNAAWLASRLDGYSLHLCPAANQRGEKEGLAILSRLPVENHTSLALAAQNRVAQRLVVQHAGHRWCLVNTHLFWSPLDDPVRQRQVEKILHWLSPHLHTILCGDFNAMPGYRAIRLVKHRLVSAYEVYHGQEPDYTFPTPLKRGPGLRHTMRRTALKMIGQVLDPAGASWRGAVDYIFIQPSTAVLDCQVVFDKPSPSDQAIYPSDHFGLYARLAPPTSF